MAWLSILPIVFLQVFFLRGAQSQRLRFPVDEEAPPGTVLGTLAEEAPGAASAGEVAARGFQLVKAPGNGSLVRVRERDGQLSLGTERLDREQLCGGGGGGGAEAPCLLAFDVLSLGGPAGSPAAPFRLLHVELEVRDINDHAPRFPQPLVTLEVSESAAPGTRLPLPLAHDPDAGSNGLQSFALSPGSPFGLEAQSRADGLRCAELVLLRGLDREAQAGYRLELVAADGGSPPRSGTATLSVRVLDANDNAPAFPRGALLTLELPEDAPPGALLLELAAADADEGANGQLLYAWGSQVGAEARRLFSLDPLSGRLALRAPVDHERQRAYELDVQVSDRGASPLSASCKVLVRLLDVNDNAPALAISALAPGGHGAGDGADEAAPDGPAVASVSEAAAAQSLVALVSTSDSDAGANGQVRCALVAAPHQPFALQRAYDAASYLVLTTGPLDRERVAEYNLTLVAEDLGSPPAKTVRSLTVRVADENDNAPRFAKARYEVALPENNPPGAYLTTVAASDPDFGSNSKVTYRLLGTSALSNLFWVDTHLGVMRVQSSLDREDKEEEEEASPWHEVVVEACDSGIPSLCGRTLVVITVEDQNDNAPQIIFPPLVNGLAELPLPLGAPPGFLIARLAARDADDGPNSELSFSLLEGLPRLFGVHPLTGELFLREWVPRELAPGSAFHLVVAVEDGGQPALTCSATLRLICTEMLPSSRPMVVLQFATAGEEPWDASVLWITLLGGGCGVLLVAILLMGTSIWAGRKKFLLGKASKKVGGGSSPISQWGNGIPKDSAGSGGFWQAEEESLDSLGVTETKTPTCDSQAQILIPVEAASEWEASQSASNFSYSGLDHVSVQDSGKGNSKCNDSDFNTSRDGMKQTSLEKVGKQNGATASVARTTCKESSIYNSLHAHLSLGRKHLPSDQERGGLLSCPTALISRPLIQLRNTHCHPEFLPQSQDCLPVRHERLSKVCEQVHHSGTNLIVNSQECQDLSSSPQKTSEIGTSF